MEALFFTDKQQVYKVRLAELEDGKVAADGHSSSRAVWAWTRARTCLCAWSSPAITAVCCSSLPAASAQRSRLSSYATKQNRRKLLKAYSDKEPLAKMLFLPEETELAIRTSASRMLLVGTAQIAAKTTRDSQGVAVVTLKKNQTIASCRAGRHLELANPHRYRVRSLPATGALIRAEDEGSR